MAWLVTGGAGYIGAHVTRAMTAVGCDVVVLDDMSTGRAERIGDCPTVIGSVEDLELVRDTLQRYAIRGIVHLAAKKQVSESVSEPLRYYQSNLTGLIDLLECCREQAITRFVFSSSAAVYAPSNEDRISEDAECRPASPYGETKLLCEWLIYDCVTAWGLNAVCLRYFNVAGAVIPALGDRTTSNLIPRVFDAVARGRRPQVFGTDYPTPDGTAIRDYVHVGDVAAAHVAAAKALQDRSCQPYAVYNVGTGTGSSVLEVLRAIGAVTGMDTTPDIVGRRPGDVSCSVAAIDRITDELGVVARADLEQIIRSAWQGWQYHHQADDPSRTGHRVTELRRP